VVSGEMMEKISQIIKSRAFPNRSKKIMKGMRINKIWACEVKLGAAALNKQVQATDCVTKKAHEE